MENKTNYEEIKKIYSSLREFLMIYEEINTGRMCNTPELKKYVQNSIKELCTLLITKTSN